MDLRVCLYFLTILEQGSMNKAAARLHITQPTLSRQIAQLEEDLGVLLFERKSKSLQPTAEGLLFAKRAQELLNIEARTRTELLSIAGGIQGTLTIGSGEFQANHLLLRLIREFIHLHPDVTVSMVSGNADLIKEQIEDGTIDLGLFLEPVELCGYETLDFPLRERWAAILPAHHPLSQKHSLSAKDLADKPLIFPLRKEPSALLEHWFEGCEPLRICARTSLSASGSQMVIEHYGILISLADLPAYLSSDLVQIPLDPPIESSIVLGWKKRFPKAPLLESFLDFMQERLSLYTK